MKVLNKCSYRNERCSVLIEEMIKSSIDKVMDKYKKLEDKSFKNDKSFKYQVNLRLNFSND